MSAVSRAERAASPHQTAGSISRVRGWALASGLTWFYSYMAVKSFKFGKIYSAKIIPPADTTILIYYDKMFVWVRGLYCNMNRRFESSAPAKAKVLFWTLWPPQELRKVSNMAETTREIE